MSSAQGGEDERSSSSGTGEAELPPLLTAAFAAGGEMGERLRAFDWSTSPLGEPQRWPRALCHAVSMMLSSRAQIVMFWGADHRAFYNDSYRPTIGAKHPAVIGQPARVHWAETWEVLGPLLDGVRRTGEPYRGENHPFVLDRHGFLEDVYFDVSYDPIRDADGTVNGVFCFVNETTGRVVGERRLRALAELGSQLADVQSTRELGRVAARVLDGYRADVPFSLLWLNDSDGSPALAGCAGVDPDRVVGGPPEPPVAAADAPDKARPVPVGDLLGGLPPDAAEHALVLPITATNEPAGVLVLGLARRLPLTDEYLDFTDLVAAQISRAVGRQRAYEQERARAAELNRFALRLPADPTRLSVLRKRLEKFLVAHGVGEDDLFDLTVAISEAAANAIEHPLSPAEPVIDVEVRIEGRTVAATVRDSGRWRESADSGFRGRGLALIKALGDLTVRRTAEGTELTLRRQLRD